MPSRTGAKKASKSQTAETYDHPESTSPMRPEVGTQTRFKKKKNPHKYRYDDSLAPSLEWDGQNPVRERGEASIARAEEELAEAQKALARVAQPPPAVAGKTKATDEGAGAAQVLKDAQEHVGKAHEEVRQLKALSKPFLNWAGKAERISFDVPTLPLFIHERLSTKAILETLKGHRRDKQTDMFELFGDPKHSIVDQTLKAYEHQDKWVNRMILGDSLVVMNSLLRYEALGGEVQMIYIDPPYGIRFGSNFQPFVRSREVAHGDDDAMTREPEMVQAYRDTWEMGIHSYLTYLRDRLLCARELLTISGSIFVQIGDENLHHVRELLDEVFGPDNFCNVIDFQKSAGQATDGLPSVSDYILWYAKDKDRLKYHQLYQFKTSGTRGGSGYSWVELSDTSRRKMTKEEYENPSDVEGKIFSLSPLTSSGFRNTLTVPFEWEGVTYHPGPNYYWKVHPDGLKKLGKAARLMKSGNKIYFIRYLEDFPVVEITDSWRDTSPGFQAQAYVVQTLPIVIQRCLLMSTEPGDLVLDPTCGSGTTAYVAEQWGRRWITCDTSRVPLALARQRLLTATFDYYELKDESRGPAGGFVYKRKQNSKGEEVGGIVPHITLKSIANNEPPAEEVLVDRPEIANGITRVTGPFCVEATIPTPRDWGEDTGQGANTSSAMEEHGSFVDRMIEVLRRSPVLRLEGNKTVTLKNVRLPAKTLSLSAEATIDATADGRATLEQAVREAKEKNGLALPLSQKPVAIIFGPENGAVTESLVRNAHDEASMKSKGYEHLYVIGFAIEPNARQYVEYAAQLGVPATYVQATPDLSMGDLLKNMRSSQIFSVTGLPDVVLRKAKKSNGAPMYEVELLGLDVFDPVNMEAIHKKGENIPAWFLDTDYNGLCFHVSQAFFPKTGAWENLKKALKTEYEEGVWEHLAGTVSTPFEAGEKKQVAVKVIDDRGNELLLVKDLAQAER